MDLLEDDWVERQEEVKKAIDKGHVDRQEQDDGLCEQHTHGSAQVLFHQFADVDLNFLLLKVKSPVSTALKVRLNWPKVRGGFFQRTYFCVDAPCYVVSINLRMEKRLLTNSFWFSSVARQLC